jgi:hypothetical protein
MAQSAQLPQSAWELANQQGRRAFYERATDTLRSCPENYCLAYRTKDGRWHVYRDEGATRAQHDAFAKIILDWQAGSTGDAIADLLGEHLRSIDATRERY